MTTYRIWSDDQDEDDATQRDATCPEDAARDQAEHDNSRCNWEGDRATYLVEDVKTGRCWRVDVKCEMEPSFYAGRPVEVEP